ncbi:MAG: hypothetical protein HFH87_15890 [Lachnospiraceae bacterium]|nr:hypothetical protein [Lachnospiraceae bacterium]
MRKKAAKGRSPEEIAEMMEEELAQIKEICELLKYHPGWSDERICEELKNTALNQQKRRE